MTPEQKELFVKLVEQVEMKYRAEAASKVKYALETGWEKIGYWSETQNNAEYTPEDLIGIDPDGNFNYLLDPVEVKWSKTNDN